jgi:hypothetical protein
MLGLLTLPQKLQNKIMPEPMSGCWIWSGARTDQTPKGYGIVWIGKKCIAAHRAVYMLLIGQIADDLELDHLCRLPACVNPNHMEQVTHLVNCKRGTAGARILERSRAVTHCPKGHEYSSANTKLSRNWFGGLSRKCRACDRERHRKK